MFQRIAEYKQEILLLVVVIDKKLVDNSTKRLLQVALFAERNNTVWCRKRKFVSRVYKIYGDEGEQQQQESSDWLCKVQKAGIGAQGKEKAKYDPVDDECMADITKWLRARLIDVTPDRKTCLKKDIL